MEEKETIIITDTSVLINFLKIDQTDLLKMYDGNFLITEHVIDEVTHYYPEQKIRLKKAIHNNTIEIVIVDQNAELLLFNNLSRDGRFGAGECSAIACAINRGYSLAIDDIRARKQAEKISTNLQILTTQQIMINLINGKIITVMEADKIKQQWEQHHRFSLKIKSFCEIVS